MLSEALLLEVSDGVVVSVGQEVLQPCDRAGELGWLGR